MDVVKWFIHCPLSESLSLTLCYPTTHPLLYYWKKNMGWTGESWTLFVFIIMLPWTFVWPWSALPGWWDLTLSKDMRGEGWRCEACPRRRLLKFVGLRKHEILSVSRFIRSAESSVFFFQLWKKKKPTNLSHLPESLNVGMSWIYFVVRQENSQIKPANQRHMFPPSMHLSLCTSINKWSSIHTKKYGVYIQGTCVPWGWGGTTLMSLYNPNMKTNSSRLFEGNIQHLSNLCKSNYRNSFFMLSSTASRHDR